MSAKRLRSVLLAEQMRYFEACKCANLYLMPYMRDPERPDYAGSGCESDSDEEQWARMQRNMQNLKARIHCSQGGISAAAALIMQGNPISSQRIGWLCPARMALSGPCIYCLRQLAHLTFSRSFTEVKAENSDGWLAFTLQCLLHVPANPIVSSDACIA